MDFVFNICSSMKFIMKTDNAADQRHSAVKSAELFADGISGKIVDSEYVSSGVSAKIVNAEFIPHETVEV